MTNPAVALRQMLSALYVDGESCRRVVQEAGIDTTWIDFDGAIGDVWFKVLLFTNPRRLTGRLLEFVAETDPQIRPLAASYLAWHEETAAAAGGGATLGVEVDRTVRGMRALERGAGAAEGCAGYRLALEQVAQRITILRALKGLHDLLHTFSNTADSPVDLRAAAHDPAAAANRRRLSRFVQGLLHACERAAHLAQDLPHAHGVRDIEINWIEKLTVTAGDLRDRLQEGEADAVLSALDEVRERLRAAPSALNERIVISARILPLAPLADMLDRILPPGNPDDAARRAAETARLGILSIATQVRERVAEHDLWQEVDDKLEAMLDILHGDHPNRTRQFATLWSRQLKPRLQQLSRLDSAGTWIGPVFQRLAVVEDQLATETVDDRLIEEFETLCWEARQQFYRVDVRLMAGTADLAPLNAPLLAAAEPDRIG